MDSRDGKKKKESIDDILSDLNGLLNKMPSILDGIRIPAPQPEEPKPAPRPEEPKHEPRQPVLPPQPAEADKTVVLPAFTGLPEGAPAPAEKAPEIPEPLQEPAPAVPAPAEKAPETPEPLQEPAPAVPVPAADAGEKTIILEAFNGLPEGAASPEPVASAPAEAAPDADRLVPQSLGDFMFGEGAQDAAAPAEPREEKPAEPVELPQPSPQEAEPPAPAPAAQEEPTGPAPAAQEEPTGPAPEAVFHGLPAEPVSLPTFGLPDSQADSTRDFGIPDIDALLQLSEDAPAPQPAASGPQPVQPGPAPEPAPAAEASLEPAAAPGEPVPDDNELAEFERQLTAAAPQQGGKVDDEKPEEKIGAVPPQEEQQPAAGAVPEAFIIEPEPFKEADLEAFTIEPAAREEAAPQADSGETLRLEPSVQPDAETPVGQTPAEPVIEAGPGISLGEPAAQEPQSAQGAQEISLGAPADLPAEAQPQPEPALEPVSQQEPVAAPEEPQLTVGTPGENTQQFSVQPPQGIELEPASAVISGGAAAAPGLTGDETLVVAPPSGAPGAPGEEEKTVIFEAGTTMPGITTRSQAGDLAGLAGRQVPEGIPDERVKGLVFLYAPEDKALCATVMAELDAICLKSRTKPMFIKRSALRECDLDLNSNVALQMVHDSAAVGAVCVGSVPQEKIYEMENTFAGGNAFFRHYDSSSFSHSAALDLVADLILR